MQQICGTKATLAPDKLIRRPARARARARPPSRSRFAVLANFPGRQGGRRRHYADRIRQGLAALLNGMLALMAIMFVSSALMVSVLFSAIVTERRRELGLLRAIGARRGQVLGILLTEAALATGAGGLAGFVVGVLLMRCSSARWSIIWKISGSRLSGLTAARWRVALLRILFASLIGAAGALCPAWRASRGEPYDSIRSEG